MSDAAIMALAGSAVTIVTMVVGFFTLLIKLKYGVKEAKEAAEAAAIASSKAAIKTQNVEDKLDANTATTESVNQKADTIVSQTNGITDTLKSEISHLKEEVRDLKTQLGKRAQP